MRRVLQAFGSFWYEFLIGEDWKIAAAVVAVLAVGAVGVVLGVSQAMAWPPLIALGLAIGFLLVFAIDLRSHR